MDCAWTSRVNIPPKEPTAKGWAPKYMEAYFWDRVEIVEGSCWNWKNVKREGYGVFKRFPAYRIAYEHVIGPVPKEHELHHTCLNRACVNPYHLQPLTREEHLAAHVALRAEARTAKETWQKHQQDTNPVDVGGMKP